MIYNIESLCQPSSSTPWGSEVKNRLAKKGMRQNDLVDHLISKGYKIDKVTLTYLLQGRGVYNRMKEIKEINDFLEIPFKY